ncbi:hypothetical protein D3C84_495780 [compost metagenome]
MILGKGETLVALPNRVKSSALTPLTCSEKVTVKVAVPELPLRELMPVMESTVGATSSRLLTARVTACSVAGLTPSLARTLKL